METISIQVEPQIAQAYRAFAPQRQKQVQMLMSIVLKRSIEQDSLEKTVADLRDEAEANGLTPEILEELLADE
ncbi:MAG: hypothetical protein ACK6CP_13285 [Pseudanabaena sp.]|jgi:hypothetical protein|nr:hypothetical protein [Pseudanabaena sp. M090S1SP2A07QC]MCA6506402.1 hypothetical protein [Pseudanabaena sp. M172S2SP2A07QC]MCA6509408.1 hypothetical protein [Pseudanabaena sp. M109S1SP2A07QC]MCA6520847.1 hypothetical protein [Pseudanabaena sp. M051S1SP2A07QC]MCA6525769.1 hypothetical protein [Pseudanabaena sp. M179S2SP2A07QC]MCA6528652.1 hypothetical protein [Pseudanabaena sp. M125S2SP2A07QC]MCA6536286.1 hypothetical protein [Pseudanabaena sp. M176S2SP2A07QC]MCA6539509.1 hypothetical prot